MRSDSVYNRTEILIGKENIELLKTKHVVICGIGGVGSFVLEALARVGIGKITVIDKDVIDITNINRQILALNSTIGKRKVDVALDRIKDINSDINVNTVCENITCDNVSKLLSDEDISYVVDCVDNVSAKIGIISFCNNKNIPCISCMGTANKLNPLDLRVADISKTNTCPLARIVRKRLKEIGILHQKVVFSVEVSKGDYKKEEALGSVSFVPSCAGIIIASEVVKDLIKRQ